MDHLAIEPLNRVFIQLGPIAIYWYAIFITLGIIIGGYLAAREGKKMGIDSEFFIDLLTFGFPIAFLGARLYYIIFNWDFYAQNPERIFRFREGGIAIHGSLIAAFIFGWFFCKRRNIMPWLLADLAGVSYLIAQAIGRWGNFMNQEAHGYIVPGNSLDAQREYLQSLWIPNFIIDNMFIDGAYYHPTFLYESLWNLVGFLIAVFILRRLSKVLVGEIGAFYAVWYSIGRYFIEGMRTDSLMVTENMMIAQLLSILIILIVITLVIGRRVLKKNLKTYQSFYVK